MSRKRQQFVLLVLVPPLLALFWIITSSEGDLSGHYTDHLRHMGEAVALVKRGFEIYSLSYGQATEGLRLPCQEHVGLWQEQPIPYPPLGILLHWPTAFLESRGLLYPWLSHRLTVMLWLAVACGACIGAVLLFHQHPTPAKVGLWLVFVPLTIGIGANGFVDTAYIFCAVLALTFIQRRQFGRALVLFALSGALHFRALVYAPMIYVAAKQLWNQQRLRAATPFALATMLMLPSVAAAWMIRSQRAVYYPDNPVYYTHHSRAFAALMLLALAVGMILFRKRQFAATSTLAASLVLTVVDPLHGWWHAAVLTAPALVLASALEPSNHPSISWYAAWAWAVLGGYLAFRHALSPYWQWVDFAIRGVH